MLSASKAYSEVGVSVAVKEGFHLYDRNRKSVYIDNNIYDNEWAKGGAYARYTFKRYFARVDYEYLNTGDEFDHNPGFPYEGVHLRQQNVIPSLGLFITEYLYVGAGIGLGFNEYQILAFRCHPASLNTHNSTIYAIYAGIEKELYKGVYAFLEWKKDWEKVKVDFDGKTPGSPPFRNTFKENISDNTLYAGLGWKF